MKQVMLICTLIFIGFYANAHKYYVSIAEMEYDAEANKIDVSLKVTAHDFEAILEKKFNQRVHLEQVSDTSEMGVFVIEYIRSKFILRSNEKNLHMHYLGKEVTIRDNLFFYFSFLNVEKPDEIEVESNFLTEEYSQQQNIIHYKYKDLTKSVTLVASKNKELIKFEK